MMRNRIIAVAAVLILLPQTVFAALGPVNRLAAAPGGAALNSPEERVFRIKGSDKRFVVVDANEDETEFFIVAADLYGNKQYDPNNTQKFDVDDVNNIAYWMNHDFLMSGNGDGNIFPSELLPYINYEYEWITEAGFSEGNCPADYTFRAGVALMSQTEYSKYAGRFGIIDGTNNGGWWLRTGRGLQGAKGLILRVGLTGDAPGATAGWDSNYGNGSGIKPVFYLKREFFRNVPLVPEATGAVVKSILKRYYTKEELLELYSNSDLVDSFGYQADVSLTATKFAVENDSISTELNIKNNTKLKQEVTLIWASYNKNGCISSFSAEKIVIEAKSDTVRQIVNDVPAEGYMKCFLWKADETVEILSNTIKIENKAK